MSDITIERLSHRGDGIAPGPIYVPGVLPGEVVTGRLEKNTLHNVRIVTPSADRVRAPCAHAKSCGGCTFQHASDAFVAMHKQTVVREALKNKGLETEFRAIQTSPPNSRRRAVLSARRTKSGAMAGFHGRRSDVITPVPHCLLLDPALSPGPAVAEALARIGASRKAELSVAVTRSLAGLDVAATGGKGLDGPMRIALADLAAQFDLARLAWDDEVIVTRRPPEQAFGSARVIPPPGAFLQATEEGEAALCAAVSEAVSGATHIVDLFAGCGTFSLPLAAKAQVHAVEGLGTMTEALDHGWRRARGLKRVTTEVRDLFRNPLLPEDLTGYEAAVIDPPRAGAEAQIAQLAQSRIPRVAHVSCNPVTFARDAATLIASGYALDWVQVVDQFRWSAHVELAAQFTFAGDPA